MKLNKKALPKILAGKFTKILLGSLIFNTVIITLVLLFLHRLPPQVPLFYGAPSGEDQLANNILLILPNSLAAVFNLINILLLKITNSDNFLKKTITGIGIITTALATITVIKIIFLVGNI